MDKRVNMKDIAKAAGVSTATVSYVINKTPNQSIAQGTADKVRRVISELGYVPNMAARSLSARRSHLIGIVIPQSEPGKQFMFSNPFYGELLSSIEFEARKLGYDVLLSGTDLNEKYLELAQKRSLDGIIIVGLYPQQHFEGLAQSSVPVVLVDSYCDDLPFPVVRSRDREGARVAVGHLIGKGHEGIAFITGPLANQGVSRQRFLGYSDALADAGIKGDPSWVFQGDVTIENGRAVASMLSCRGDLTAAFVTSDIVSIGLIGQLQRLGKRVPDDFSVVGFDDTYLARISNPELTAVHQDIPAKGVEAVRLLVRQIEVIGAGRKLGAEDIELPVSLVERATVGCR